MYQLNPNLREFWQTRKPYKLLKGGRFSSKTQDAGGMAAFLARNYSLRFLCIRQFQNRITDSVYTVIKNKIEQAGWTDEFDIGVSTIRHKETKSEFLFYGIARNIDDIKGTEDVDICWIEEGEGLSEKQWEVIDPTIRKEGAEVWILWNPRLQADFIQSKLPNLLGDDCTIKHINYDQNPFLSDTARKKAERLKEKDPEAYEHIYLGVPRSDDDKVIIKLSWLNAAIGAHKKLGIEITGDKQTGFDVADSGSDKCAEVHRSGVLCAFVDQWQAGEDELMQSCSRVYSNAYKKKAHIKYDSIGVGATCGSKFDELNQERSNENGYQAVRYSKFIAGGGVLNPADYYIDAEDESISNKDFFENLKAQAWWDVAQRLKNTYIAVTMQDKGEDWRNVVSESDLICIDEDIDYLQDLINELSTPRRKFSKSGKVMVESKEDLEKREIKSPNLADAFIMAFAANDDGSDWLDDFIG